MLLIISPFSLGTCMFLVFTLTPYAYSNQKYIFYSGQSNPFLQTTAVIEVPLIQGSDVLYTFSNLKKTGQQEGTFCSASVN